MSAILSVDGVSVQFGALKAVPEVSLHAPAATSALIAEANGHAETQIPGAKADAFTDPTSLTGGGDIGAGAVAGMPAATAAGAVATGVSGYPGAAGDEIGGRHHRKFINDALYVKAHSGRVFRGLSAFFRRHLTGEKHPTVIGCHSDVILLSRSERTGDLPADTLFEHFII